MKISNKINDQKEEFLKKKQHDCQAIYSALYQ